MYRVTPALLSYNSPQNSTSSTLIANSTHTRWWHWSNCVFFFLILYFCNSCPIDSDVSRTVTYRIPLPYPNYRLTYPDSYAQRVLPLISSCICSPVFLFIPTFFVHFWKYIFLKYIFVLVSHTSAVPLRMKDQRSNFAHVHRRTIDKRWASA